MTLQKNSFIAHYYRWMFNNKLPDDFCTLFWNTLLSVVFLPVIWLCWPVSWIDKGASWNRTFVSRVFLGMLYWFLFWLLPALGLAMIQEYLTHIDWNEWNFWFLLGIGWLAVLCFAVAVVIAGCIIIGILMGVVYIKEQVEEDRRLLRKLQGGEPEPSKLRVIWDTIRNKYCTKIYWNDSNQG